MFLCGLWFLIWDVEIERRSSSAGSTVVDHLGGVNIFYLAPSVVAEVKLGFDGVLIGALNPQACSGFAR